MNKVIVIRGPLGVGKTTVAKILAEKLNAEYLSVDQILDDNNLAGVDGIPVENFLKVNGIIHEIAGKSEKSFIVEGNFYYQEQIDDLKRKFNNDVVIFTLITDVEKCIERDLKRDLAFGEDSARYIHEITTAIKVGHEIDNSDLTAEETAKKIMENI